MSITQEIASRIARKLSDRCTHASMPAVALEVAQLSIPAHTGDMSKNNRVLAVLEGRSLRNLGEIAQRVGEHFCDFELEEAGLGVLEQNDPRITEITRRDIGKCFGDDLSGASGTLSLVSKFFPVRTPWDDLVPGNSLAKEIERHMDHNPGDWSVEHLFERIGALACSRRRFAQLIEAGLHPLCRRGPEQVALSEQISSLLRRDGYELVVDGEESGYPIFRLVSVGRGVLGAPKNLIFASDGPKPEIGFRDAINNDIVILSNAESCLVYERAIRRDGLLWSELVEWWRARDADRSSDPARALGLRLRASLSSDAEFCLFDTYFRIYKPRLRAELPALLPQVYLHYDPAIVKQLRHRRGLPRQRMDFLLLLPNNQRIVIEVDGAHHFSRDGKPSLQTYAEMVSADRDLRLFGYEVYRFGANELVGDGAHALVQGFFDRLWPLHKVSA